MRTVLILPTLGTLKENVVLQLFILMTQKLDVFTEDFALAF